MRTTKKFALGPLLFGILFLICGSVQIIAGISVLCLLVPLLRTASNVWTGLLNVVMGTVLIGTSASCKQLCFIFGICVVLMVINLGNLLLMEIGEWRMFLPSNIFTIHIKNGRLPLIIVAYLSTTIPSIIAFIVAVLASQYVCCTMAFKKALGLPNLVAYKKGFKTDMESEVVSFKWVFNRPTGRDWETIEQGSLLEREHFPQQLKTTENDMQMHTFPSFPHGSHLYSNENHTQGHLMEIVQPLAAINWPSTSQGEKHLTEDPSSNYPKCITTSQYLQISRAAPQKVTKNNVPPSLSPSSIRQTYPSNYQDSSVSTRPSLMPFDAESLIHLSHMELLARQWRFQCQHKALIRQASIRLATTAAAFSVTNGKVS